MGTIIQSIFCAQSGASIRLTVWKWSGESQYPGALPPALENFCRTFSPSPTDCPWVSKDALNMTVFWSLQKDLLQGSLTENFLKHNYCHAVTQGFDVSCPLPS